MLELDVHLGDDVVRAARQSEAGTKVVFQPVGQHPAKHREDVVLLIIKGISVVHETDATIELHARGEEPPVVVIDPGDVPELEALVLVRPLSAFTNFGLRTTSKRPMSFSMMGLSSN